MRYVKLGRTGLDISPLVLGCMTYGVPDRGNHEWTLDEETSRPFIRKALDLGINFFDTANAYSDGTSEEIVGRALKDFARRDEVGPARFRPTPKSAAMGAGDHHANGATRPRGGLQRFASKLDRDHRRADSRLRTAAMSRRVGEV